MDPPKRHQYTHLPSGEFGEIRLLVLHPHGSNPGSALFGSLKRVSHVDPPPYEALSYAWGSNDQTEKLNIYDGLTRPVVESRSVLPVLNSWWGNSSSDVEDGWRRPCVSFIPITPNLQSALKRLRQRSTTRVLWVDQLCINQEDVEERSSQVQLMGHIYQKASKTVVWLGEEDEHVSAALHLSSKLAAAMRAYNQAEIAQRRNTSPGQGRGPLGAFLQTMGHDADLTTYNWQAFNSFYNRPWFGRLWIIQEIAFSKEVVILCGSRTTTMPWATVDQNVMSSEAEYHQLLPYPIGFLNCFTIATIRDRIWIRSAHPGRLAASLGIRPEDLPAGKDFDPIDIIAYTKTFDCCDPKDRFFALYGLLKSMFSWSEQPDYSLTVLQVYQDMTRLLIKRDKSLKVLSGNILRYNCSDWPSWVPDWSVRDSLDRCCNGFHTLSSTFCAPGPQHVLGSNDILFPRPNFISISGWQFDTCSKILDVLEWTQRTFPEHNAILTQWIGHILEIGISLEDASVIAFRTLIADGFGTRRAGKHYVEDRLGIWLEWARSITGGTLSEQLGRLSSSTTIPKENALHLEQHTRAYDFAARSACRGRRLVVTSRGFVGLCPRYTQEGDVICILSGAKAPFVLRKSGECYTMIGECYVDGIMYGETFTSAFDTRGPLRTDNTDLHAQPTSQQELDWTKIQDISDVSISYLDNFSSRMSLIRWFEIG
ncbi:Heterokaryon incompatibility protein (HET) domain containing protein [Hyaloscypha variabilis]